MKQEHLHQFIFKAILCKFFADLSVALSDS